MSEVLADLRVLEQQQRDAQKQLMNARSTKEQRMEQHAALESKLEHIKYSNGEFRAQLRQSREVLSTSTRALGSRRLLTDKAGGEIRDFERKLNRGLQSARLNTVCRRKIESLFILLESKLDVLSRVRVEAKDKWNALEKSLKIERGREETLRTSIQGETARRQHLASEIASVRAQNREAENDLLVTQNMEESTRTRAKAITSQLNAEKKGIEDHHTELSNQITHEEEKVSSLEEENILLDENLAGILQDLDQAKTMLDIPQEHVTNLGRCDNDRVKTIIETNHSTLREIQGSNDAIHHEVEKLLAEIDASVNLASSNRSESHNLTKVAKEMLVQETGRREELKIFKSELEKERIVVENLETSAANLLDIRRVASAKHEKALIECDIELEQLQLSIDVVRQGIEHSNVASGIKKDEWEAESAQLLTELERTKHATNAAEAKLNELDLISKDLESHLQDKLCKELMCVEAQKTKCAQEISDKVSSIVKRRPQLDSVVSDFVYDATFSKREHIMQALGEIKAKLEGKIRDAKSSVSRRKQMRTERKREAESVASLVQQHDETRRKNRERKSAKHKVQKVERRDSNLSIDHDSDTSQFLVTALEGRPKESRSKSSSITVKGADFFCPLSHDVLSDDESPAHPKSLLSAFSIARAANSKPYINSALGMDRRVHWKDDGCDDLAVDTTLLRMESTSASKIEQRSKVGSHEDGDTSDDEGTIANTEVPDHVSKRMGVSTYDLNDSDVDSIIIEESDTTTFRRKGRQYGTAKRGLAAIARSRKSSIKQPQIDRTGSSTVSNKVRASKNSTDARRDNLSTKEGGLDSRTSVHAERRMLEDNSGKTGKEPKAKATSMSGGQKSKQTARTRVHGNVTMNHDRGVRAATNPTRTAIQESGNDHGNTTEKTDDRKSLKASFRQSVQKQGRMPDGGKDNSAKDEKQRLKPIPPNDSCSVHSRHSEPAIISSRSPSDARTPASSSSYAHAGLPTDKARSNSQYQSNSAEARRRSIGPTKIIESTSKKRKLQEKADLPTQKSGLSSSENAPKSRRRKKNWPAQRTTAGIAEDLYAFAF